MKIRPVKIVILFSLLLVVILFFSGIGGAAMGLPPPNDYIMNPVVINDGSGGLIIAYQVNSSDQPGCTGPGKGPITYVQRRDPDGNIIWDGVRLDSGQPYSETWSPTALMKINDDDCVAFWGTDGVVWAQNLDITTGEFIWDKKLKVGKSQDIRKLKAIGGESGTVILGYYNQEGSFYLQKIDSEGEFLWPGGITMQDLVSFDIARDPAGNTLLMWTMQDHTVNLQKYEHSGRPVWASPARLADEATESEDIAWAGQYFNWIIPDSLGGSIVGYVDTYEVSSIAVQRIGSQGNRLWSVSVLPPTGENVSSEGFGAANRLISDGAGGAFVLWKVILSHWGGDTSIFARHIDSSGNNITEESDWEITNNAFNEGHYALYEAIPDGSGGMVVIWESEIINERNRNPYYLFAQRIDKDNNKLWGDSGIKLTTTSSMNGAPLITLDSSGGFIVSIGKGYSDIINIGPDGEILWELKL